MKIKLLYMLFTVSQ